MNVFKNYARFYDGLNAAKNYADESRFVLSQLTAAGLGKGPILEIGCGTGGHALEFAKAGHAVTGIDRSEAMIEIARERAEAEGLSAGLVSFERKDAQHLDWEAKFPAATSLFHVVSYLVEDEVLDALFAGVRKSLVPGGLFLFDFWYGPAVLKHAPEHRTKEAPLPGGGMMKRSSKPALHPERNRVDVHISVETLDASGVRSGEVVEETHPMRYFFLPEIRQLAERHGFEVLREGDWMSEAVPHEDSWYAYCVLRS